MHVQAVENEGQRAKRINKAKTRGPFSSPQAVGALALTVSVLLLMLMVIGRFILKENNFPLIIKLLQYLLH